MAVSGIDDTVKIFSPTASPDKRFSHFDRAETITARNTDPNSAGTLGMSSVGQHIVCYHCD